MPIFMTRLVADSGGIMNGGAAHVGSVGVTLSMRSWTSCRDRIRSVPALKISSICDSWGTDFERRTSSPWMPGQRLLERHGDERLDVGRGQAQGRGLDLDPGRGELGKDVDR